MITVPVEQGQNMMDMALQHLGDMTGLFALAKANGISITEVLIPGAMLNKPPVINKDVVNYFFEKQIIPATEEDEAVENNVPQTGIGFMIIGQTFIVS